MTELKLRRSENPRDISKAMEVVKTFGATPENLIKIEAYIAKEFQELGKNRLLYLLEDEKRILGMVQLILKNADGDAELANGKEIAHIHSLQVAKDIHRQGLGILIMEQLEADAKRLGIKILTLGVDGDNEKAKGLYKKLNYQILKELEGREPGVPLIYMFKDLN